MLEGLGLPPVLQQLRAGGPGPGRDLAGEADRQLQLVVGRHVGRRVPRGRQQTRPHVARDTRHAGVVLPCNQVIVLIL